MSSPAATTPAHVLMARDAATQMSDAQKVAFAIELATSVTDQSSTWHLDRLSRAARSQADDMRRETLLREMR